MLLADIYTISTANDSFAGSLADVLLWHASMQGEAASITPALPDAGQVTLPASAFEDEIDSIDAAIELVAGFVEDVEVDAKWGRNRDEIIVFW